MKTYFMENRRHFENLVLRKDNTMSQRKVLQLKPEKKHDRIEKHYEII